MNPEAQMVRSFVRAAVAVLALALTPGVRIGYGHDGHDAYGVHAHQNEKPATTRSLVAFKTPLVTLVRDDGVSVEFDRELQSPQPIYLNFIFTSCTSVCPVMSQIFSQTQEALGADRDRVRMISVSIDPEQDTPERLAAYARQFDAGPQWRFYTGSLDASISLQKAFKVYSRDKMNHPVATFYRSAPGQRWVRIDGFATPAQLEHEYRAQNGN
jgi:protein SCO1/2